MEFLVQYTIEGSEKIINKIVNSCWIIEATNESDFNGIEEMHVFDITDLGKIKPLHYRGWQPGCLIEYVDDKNSYSWIWNRPLNSHFMKPMRILCCHI